MMDKKWYHIDANGKNLGRLAAKIATVLAGKHKPTYVAHEDAGDFIIVTNVEKIAVTGNKEIDKKYYRHSQYPSGLKVSSLKEMREKHPEQILELAVEGMLPQNKLRDKRMKKLKVYAGDKHPHAAQSPEALKI